MESACSFLHVIFYMQFFTCYFLHATAPLLAVDLLPNTNRSTHANSIDHIMSNYQSLALVFGITYNARMNPVKDDTRKLGKPTRQRHARKDKPDWLSGIKPSRQRDRKRKDRHYG